MQQHATTYSVLTHILDPLCGVKGQNIFFSESSHVAYQIEGNGAYSIMRAHILSLHILNPWVGSKGQNIFSESSHVAYQIKGNGT